jgi:hypothetical protein
MVATPTFAQEGVGRDPPPDVRFEQTFAPQKVMSALLPKADIHSAGACLLWANSGHSAFHSITSAARASSAGGRMSRALLQSLG